MITATNTGAIKLLGALGANLDNVAGRNMRMVGINVDQLLRLVVPRQDLDLAHATLFLELELKADTVLRVARTDNKPVRFVLVPLERKRACNAHGIKDKGVVEIVLNHQLGTVSVGRAKLKPGRTTARRTDGVKDNRQKGLSSVVANRNDRHGVVVGGVGQLGTKRAVAVGVIIVPFAYRHRVDRNRVDQTRTDERIGVLVDPLGLQQLEPAVQARGVVATANAALVNLYERSENRLIRLVKRKRKTLKQH